jgi:hypothetical protein
MSTSAERTVHVQEENRRVIIVERRPDEYDRTVYVTED